MVLKTYETQRRSTRVRAQIPLRVTNLDGDSRVSESCRTLLINTQGCGVSISQPLIVGSRVQLDELPSGVIATAKVMNCVPLGNDGKHWLAGLALEETGNIWGLSPAPADWESMPSNSATKPSSARAAKADGKKGEWPYSVFSPRGEAHPGRR